MRYKALILALLVALGVAAGYLIWRGSLSGGGSQAHVGLVFGQPTSSGSGPWTVTLQGTNAGASTLDITSVKIGGMDFTGQVAAPGLPLVVQPGGSFVFSTTVASGAGGTFTPGEVLTVDVETSDGTIYGVQASLPASTTSAPGNGGGGIESLHLTASVVDGTLNVTVLNMSPGTVTFLHVYFNGLPAGVTYGSGFINSSPGQLPSATTGSFTIATSGTVSGALYTIDVVTAAGNSFQTTVSWP